jgi:hypothetical protein
MTMTEVILDEGPLYGEIAFDRTRMQNRITELETQLAQVNRLHEGLVKEKEEAFAAREKALQSKVDAAQQHCRTLEQYTRVIKEAWQEVTDEEFPAMGGWKLDPQVDPAKFGYILKEGTYHKVDSINAGSLYMADGKGTLLPLGSTTTEATPEPIPYKLILDDD